ANDSASQSLVLPANLANVLPAAAVINPGSNAQAAAPAPALTATSPAEVARPAVEPVAIAIPAPSLPSPPPAAAPEPEDLSPPLLSMLPGTEPSLPDSLMRKMRRGSVQVKVDVGVDGRVASASVEQSSHPRLENPAIEAVRSVRFQPVLRPASAVINLEFDLDR
ncbi:TonB family protein, partial [Ideonella sp.]|uniref:TonB family protein n=1 Tax=Ideonella sp. TaxID=1929293 RepID=UPI003BB64CEF